MYKENQNFRIREEDGFYLAYDYVAHIYYQLNEMAIIVINEAIKHDTIDEIVKGVCATTGDQPNEAKDDILQGISQLVDIGILQHEK